LTANLADTTLTIRAHNTAANGALQLSFEGQNFNIVPTAAHNPALGQFGYLRLGTGASAEWVSVNTVTSYDTNTGIGISP